MSDDNAKLAHELLDVIGARKDLTLAQVEVLRDFLPERPKPVTLDGLRRKVLHAVYAVGTASGHWPDLLLGDVRSWMDELHRGLEELTHREMSPHPEFLETKQDYESAPNGTIAAEDGEGNVWIRYSHGWTGASLTFNTPLKMSEGDLRRVLRWGMGSD